MIIDGHLIAATPDEELDAYGRFLKAHGRDAGYAEAADLIASMDKDGVDFGVLLEGPNWRRAAFIAEYPKRLGAFAGVSLRALAESPEKTLAEARSHLNAGFLGLGQIGAYREGFDLDHPALRPLYELAVECGKPIHFECTCPVGCGVPGRVSTPLYDFEQLAYQYPQLKMILSSWGGGLCLFEMMPELPRPLTNVYYDTASPVDDFDVDKMMQTVPKIVRTRKILYGSASPLLPRNLRCYQSAHAPKEVIFGVLGNNMRLLLGK